MPRQFQHLLIVFGRLAISKLAKLHSAFGKQNPSLPGGVAFEMRFPRQSRERERRLGQSPGFTQSDCFLELGVGRSIIEGRSRRNRGIGATVRSKVPNPETEGYCDARRQQNSLPARRKSGCQSTYPVVR